jgi:hypothetical protein
MNVDSSSSQQLLPSTELEMPRRKRKRKRKRKTTRTTQSLASWKMC